MEKLLLRPTEVAELLGIGRTRAYELLSTGALPGVIRIGRSLRVSTEALRRWIAAQAQVAGDEPVLRKAI